MVAGMVPRWSRRPSFPFPAPGGGGSREEGMEKGGRGGEGLDGMQEEREDGGEAQE